MAANKTDPRKLILTEADQAPPPEPTVPEPPTSAARAQEKRTAQKAQQKQAASQACGCSENGA
jgi:hypothetical protein